MEKVLLSIVLLFSLWQTPVPSSAKDSLHQAPVPSPAKKEIKLKPEVALPIRDLQLKQTQRILVMKQIEMQYQQDQKDYQEDAKKLSDMLKDALKASGLENEKYVLNGDTLEVTEVPVAPKKEKP